MIERIANKLKRDGIKSVFRAIIKYPFGFKKRRIYKQMLTKENIADRFSEIYKQNLWSSTESGSGDGSELNSTKLLSAWLIDTIPKLGIKEFVDASCGDFNWMKYTLQSLECNYLGIDIVTSVINKNIKLHSNNLIRFEVADICKDKIPACDLIMVRDCLFHLSYKDIEKFLHNLNRTNYKYLLTTTHITDQRFKNRDITTGDFRIINLFCSPFNFKESLLKDRVLDYPIGYSTKKEMILIAKKDVPIELNIPK